MRNSNSIVQGLILLGILYPADCPANMQKTILDGLQNEINYIEEQLSKGVRGSQASILQRQLRELIKQRNTASEKYFNAINEAEEYRLQQLEKNRMPD